MDLGHLVEDADAVVVLRRVLDRQLDTAHRVLDMDEGTGLAAGAVDGERVADRRLHKEAVEHGPVVAVVVKAIDQPIVQAGVGGLRAPHDPLMQVGDQHPVVLVVEREHELILGLGHVVDAARIDRIEDLLLQLVAIVGVDLDPEVALGDLHARRSVPVDAHRAEMDHVRRELRLDEGREQVVGGVDVVVDGVALVPRALHRVRSRPLLGEVHDRIRLPLDEQIEQLPVVLGDVEAVEGDLTAGQLPPGVQTCPEWLDRRQRFRLELDVGVAPREVVDDCHLVAAA